MHEHEPTPRKVFLEPDDFLGIISIEQLQEVLNHQQTQFEAGRIIDSPLPKTTDKQLQTTYEAFANNIELYDDHPVIEATISDDPGLESIRPSVPERTLPEQSRAIRARISTLVAKCVLEDAHVGLQLVESDEDGSSVTRVA
jgi:hypothetical protein